MNRNGIKYVASDPYIMVSIILFMLLLLGIIRLRRAYLKYRSLKSKKCFWGGHEWYGTVMYHFQGGCSFNEICKDCNKKREMTKSLFTGYDKTGRLISDKKRIV